MPPVGQYCCTTRSTHLPACTNHSNKKKPHPAGLSVSIASASLCPVCHLLCHIAECRQLLKRTVPPQVTGAVGWRKEGLRYKKNEVFLDIVEQVNMLMSAKGTVLRCDVNGKVVMKVFLSGMPDVKLGLNDALEVSQRCDSCRGSSLSVACQTRGQDRLQSCRLQDSRC